MMVQVTGRLWVYQLYKRGLLHAHIFLYPSTRRQAEDERDIDTIVCAELPDRGIHPGLGDIVQLQCVLARPIVKADRLLKQEAEALHSDNGFVLRHCGRCGSSATTRPSGVLGSVNRLVVRRGAYHTSLIFELFSEDDTDGSYSFVKLSGVLARVNRCRDLPCDRI